MARFLLARVLQSIVTLFILTTIVFVLVRVTGSPVDFLAGPEATEETKALIAERLGLNRPYPVQYFIFITDALQGDLGESFLFRRPTTEVFFERLPATLMLTFVGVAFALLIAVPLGVISGTRRNSFADRIARLAAVI